jgi:hypothetical protein
MFRKILCSDAFHVVTAVAIAVPLAFASSVPAQSAKKLTYEQAFAKCKAQIDRTIAGDQQTNRATAGGGCMMQYGYRLKR